MRRVRWGCGNASAPRGCVPAERLRLGTYGSDAAQELRELQRVSAGAVDGTGLVHDVHGVREVRYREGGGADGPASSTRGGGGIEKTGRLAERGCRVAHAAGAHLVIGIKVGVGCPGYPE